jgi:hypothetical protein
MYTLNIVRYPGFRLVQHQLIKNTFVTFSDRVDFSFFPHSGGPTVRNISGVDHYNGIRSPGSYMDLREISKGTREVFVIETGYTCCFTAVVGAIMMSYSRGTETILPPNTMAIILNGSVEFNDRGKIKKANQYNLIVKRPYEVTLLGEAEIALAVKD